MPKSHMPAAAQLFSVRFEREDPKGVIFARVYPPEKRSRLDRTVGKKLIWWEARCVVRKDGTSTKSAAAGATWIQALLMALEFIRKAIPTEEEDAWHTEEGLPSWVVLPRTLPYSWGYREYCEARDLIEAIECRREAGEP